MLEKKTDELTDMRELVSFHRSLWNALPWLPLFNSFAICTRRIEQFQRSMNCDMKCLQKRMCLDRLPPTLDALVMVAAPPPPILGGDLKISDQNNWGGPDQKIKFGRGGKLI